MIVKIFYEDLQICLTSSIKHAIAVTNQSLTLQSSGKNISHLSNCYKNVLT